MSSSTPSSANGKKLIQARLSFFKAPEKYNIEPLSKTLKDKDNDSDTKNVTTIDITTPVKINAEIELTSETKTLSLEKHNEQNNEPIIEIACEKNVAIKPDYDSNFTDSPKIKKRVNSEEILKESKKLKLDAEERLESNQKNEPSSINNDMEISEEINNDNDCSIIEDSALECSIRDDLNSTLDTSCEMVVDSPGITDSANKGTAISKSSRKKTPKQLEKSQDAVKKREEKEKLKQEKDLKKQQEKEEKQKIKEEKEILKKKEIEEKEELKRKAKEEKERKKQQETELKNEEKRRKEEDKKRKEEEALRKKDEEKKRKEEEVQKKKEEEAQQKMKFSKEAAVFSTFFKKIQKPEGETVNIAETIVFKPFELKNRMRLAPINRNPLNDERKKLFDDCLLNQDVHETYITQLRCDEIKPGHCANTWPLEEIYQDDDNEVEELPVEPTSTTTVICGRQNVKVPRAKLLLFNENRRPPYWGTWRKKCAAIKPRRPFGIYKEFDYEVDSDDEWEEEEPGESLHGSDDEKDKDEQDGEDDYDIDNDIFVPHGYLSEDEAPADETWSVEQQKEKLKLLGEQFDQERSEKTKQLRPIVMGCIWVGSESSTLSGNTKISALLLRCRPWILECDLPIKLNCEDPDSPDDRDMDIPPGTSPATTKRGVFPEEAVSVLIKRVHGARKRHRMIAKEFVHTWSQDNPDSPLLSIAAVSRKIKEVAQWQECPEPPLLGRQCWYVSKEIRELNGLSDLPLPICETSKTVNSSLLDDSSVATSLSPSTPKITKFTRVLTEEERRLSLIKPKPINGEKEDVSILKPAEITSPAAPSPSVEKALQKLVQFRAPSTAAPPKKKVAILFSVPRGEPMIKSTEINSHIDKISNKKEEKECDEKNKIISEKSSTAEPASKDIPIIDVEERIENKISVVEPMEIITIS